MESTGLPASASSDVRRGLDLIGFLCPGTDDADVWVIPGEPVSKARARMGHGRTYQPAKDRVAEEATAWELRSRFRRPPLEGNLAIGCVFFRPNRQRIDVDNMLKHICDAATGILWVDDSQVTAVAGFAELDAARPRTIVALGKHVSTMVRGSDALRPCARCGAFITDPKRGSASRFCSKECWKRRGKTNG